MCFKLHGAHSYLVCMVYVFCIILNDRTLHVYRLMNVPLVIIVVAFFSRAIKTLYFLLFKNKRRHTLNTNSTHSIRTHHGRTG